MCRHCRWSNSSCAAPFRDGGGSVVFAERPASVAVDEDVVGLDDDDDDEYTDRAALALFVRATAAMRQNAAAAAVVVVDAPVPVAAAALVSDTLLPALWSSALWSAGPAGRGLALSLARSLLGEARRRRAAAFYT